MSNLISETAKNIYKKIVLFGEYDPLQYQDDLQYSWISSDTITNYHDDCKKLLLEGYNDIIGDLSSIDINDSTSIPLADVNTDDFVMQPEDLSGYLAQGLTYEKKVQDELFGKYMLDDITLSVIDGGNIVQFTSNISVNNEAIHPYPFTKMDLSIVINLVYHSANYYYNGTIPSTITIHNMYRGPMDNIGDRGYNYFEPLTIVSSSLSGLSSTNYFFNTGAVCNFTNKTITVTTVFDNGCTAEFELYIPFTIPPTAKITTVVPVTSNGSYIDFKGSITQPINQWSDFTRTQSPNILMEIASLESNATPPKTTLFINALVDSILNVWDDLVDAFSTGEYLDKQSIANLVLSDLLSNKVIAQIQDVSSIKRYAKTYLANRIFEASATYILNELGINTQVSLLMNTSELSTLNDQLIAIGITNFEESDGYYNWANIPNCNSKDECARFSTAIFNDIQDLEEMMNHPALSWISNNYDFIEAEILTTKTELEQVI